jgi:16S rRNA (cytidine1402-2'-O)-methyltransferase
MLTGTLYIVATPIGNLEDITYRAVRILSEVDLIAAEDTRHSRKLLSHYGISKPLTSYFDHNQQLKGGMLLEKLQDGKSVALITDAGTPCIADPGYQLVRDAVAAGISVVPIPGASALITALSAAGLPTDRFAFEGFLPARSGKRQERLKALAADPRVLVFYEAPHRLTATLADMQAVLGDRETVVARELTKIHEQFLHRPLSLLLDHFSATPPKGEVVILLPPAAQLPDEHRPDPDELLRHCLTAENLSVKDAAKRVAAATGLSRSELYERALQIRAEDGEPGC